MKSYIAHAASIYGGITKDASARWPELSGSFEKDLSYLLRAVESRGLSFYTITLPSAGKVLDRALDNGELVSSEFPQGFPLEKKRPKLFRDLFSLVFDTAGMLKPDADIDAVLFLRQYLYCHKNLRLQCDDARIMETLDEFYKIEQQLPISHEGTWEHDVPTWAPRKGHPLWGRQSRGGPDLFDPDPQFDALLPWDSLGLLAKRVLSQFGEPDWWAIRPKHGPGVVSDGRSGLKYEFPHWPRKLGLWFPFDWFGSGSFDSDSWPSDYEPPSRLIAVPKSQKGPRLICAEPTAHQWMQQGIWRWLEDRLQHSLLRGVITFRSQENSRDRALHSSLSATHATVDLSSASDRLSTRLVEYLFQGMSILDGFHACRTRVMVQNMSDKHPRMIVLRKFSTQGSALTFPVQAICFAILALWALKLTRGTESDMSRETLEEEVREITVFGDDIIIPVTALEALTLVFHECGLKVNESKTFGGLNFRESCGLDAFRGVDVTPAYSLVPYDGSPSSTATTVEVSNNFFCKGYWNTANIVVDQIPPQERKLLRVCGHDDGSFGLRSFVGSDTSHLRRGWDPAIQRFYHISLSVTSKVTRRRGGGSADLTQYFTERPDPLVKWSAGQVSKVRLRKGRTRVYE